MTMPADDPEVNRKWAEDFDMELREDQKVREENEPKNKITYCNCCGAKRINHVGECYTDCMWYDGPLPRDANPH